MKRLEQEEGDIRAVVREKEEHHRCRGVFQSAEREFKCLIHSLMGLKHMVIQLQSYNIGIETDGHREISSLTTYT